jgi:hypothetical protein
MEVIRRRGQIVREIWVLNLLINEGGRGWTKVQWVVVPVNSESSNRFGFNFRRVGRLIEAVTFPAPNRVAFSAPPQATTIWWKI